MQKHCSCLWPSVNFFLREWRCWTQREKWGMGRGGGKQAAEDGRKRIYIGLAFAMHEMQHPVPTSWRTSVGPDGEKGWVSAWGCRRRLHLHSSAQLFVEKHPGDAQPLTQLCSPSQAQPFIVVPNVGGSFTGMGNERSWIKFRLQMEPSEICYQLCRNRKSSWIKRSFTLCARTNSLEFV